MSEPIQLNNEKIATVQTEIISTVQEKIVEVVRETPFSDFKTKTFNAKSQYLNNITITITTFSKFRHVHMVVSFTESGVTRRDSLNGAFANYICGADTIKTTKKHTGVLTAFDNDPVQLLTAQTNANGILLVVPSSAKPITTYDYIGDIFWIDSDDTDEITFTD